MFFNIKQKIKSFLSSDLRWKLINISRISKINFYPNYFYKTGIKGLYTKLIFKLILNNKLKKYKNNLYNEIFVNRLKYEKNKVNFLISTPSSGSTFLRLMLVSYFELLHKIGNGIPKYDNANNLYSYAGSQLHAADLWNEITIERGKINHSLFLDPQKYEKEKFIMSRYPLSRIDLYNINQIKPVVLFREPLDQITSAYTSYLFYERKKDQSKQFNINTKVLNDRIQSYNTYINFWNNFFNSHIKNKDYLIVNYQDLVSDTKKILKQVVNFFEYELNEDNIDTCSKIHSKENTSEYFKEIKIYNKFRISDSKIKDDQRQIILPTLEAEIKKTNIYQIYNNLFK